MGVQAQAWYMDLFRAICSFLDSLIYGAIEIVLKVVFDLSNLTASSGLLEGVYTRIYVILGIFMAFKLSFSFFQYIVDPESMVGKSEKGVSKLLANTIIMIIALIGLPPILFGSGDGQGLLARAQNAFLPMLPRLILGIDESSGVSVGNMNNSDDISAMADSLSIAALQAFFVPVKEIDDVCGSGTYDGTPPITSIDQFKEYSKLTCNASASLTNLKAPKYYRYSYLPGISTAVGLLMVWVLLSIGIDVGIRVFKMIILELVAPVPIMSLIDPKSGKGGTFSKWLQLLISTFLDIFIKLGLLYLILTLVKLIISNGLFENWPEFADEPSRESFLLIAVIVALLFFAKEAPNFIKESLGMKPDKGGFGLGKGTALLGAGLTVGSAALSSIPSTATKMHHASGFGGKAAALAGGLVGAGTSAIGATARSSFGMANGKKLGDLMKAQSAVNQKKLGYAKSGSTWYGRSFNGLTSLALGENFAERGDYKVEALAAATKAASAVDDAFKNEAVTKGKGSLAGFNNGRISFAANSNLTFGMVRDAIASSTTEDVVLDGTTYSKYDLAQAMPKMEEKAIDNFVAEYNALPKDSDDRNADIENLMFEYGQARKAAHKKGAIPLTRDDRKKEKTDNTRKQTKIHKGVFYQASKKSVSNGGKK